MVKRNSVKQGDGLMYHIFRLSDKMTGHISLQVGTLTKRGTKTVYLGYLLLENLSSVTWGYGGQNSFLIPFPVRVRGALQVRGARKN